MKKRNTIGIIAFPFVFMVLFLSLYYAGIGMAELIDPGCTKGDNTSWIVVAAIISIIIEAMAYTEIFSEDEN